ncbi:MAG: hypothetical protein E7536_02690 [Ruminococcaceae bacterium]|nr:hypothetical protein [Oscillospiraceae bacterium]
MKKTFNIMTYNVSGIPVIGDGQGTQKEIKGNARMAKIGEILCRDSGCEIIGVAEDFNHHPALAKAMKSYEYQTFSKGGIPLGDGLNIFSKVPVYNVVRNKWRKSFSYIGGSSDRLAQKGILSSVVEIEKGVYIDLYVVHTDASNDPKSVVARRDNFHQLADMINSRKEDRAIIVVGDFNTTFCLNAEDEPYEILVKKAGLTDSWAEIHNDGKCDYKNEKDWNPDLKETLDRVMYKSGGGVELKAESYEYVEFTDNEGETYTDHISTRARISYEVTGVVSAPEKLEKPKPANKFLQFVKTAGLTVFTLVMVILHLYELLYDKKYADVKDYMP